jgi:hypothetical protein
MMAEQVATAKLASPATVTR